MNLVTTGMRAAAAVLAALVLAASGVAAHAQPATPPIVHPMDSVVHPSANVDPAMKVTPKRKVRLPTPVIHPPVEKGNTLVVPK